MVSKYAIERVSELFNDEPNICIESFTEELDRHVVRLYQLCVLLDKVYAIEKLVNSPHLDDFEFREQVTEVLKDE